MIVLLKRFCNDISFTMIAFMQNILLINAYICNVQQINPVLCSRKCIEKPTNQAETGAFESGVRYVFYKDGTFMSALIDFFPKQNMHEIKCFL